jgi:hypothetical protein
MGNIPLMEPEQHKSQYEVTRLLLMISKSEVLAVWLGTDVSTQTYHADKHIKNHISDLSKVYYLLLYLCISISSNQKNKSLFNKHAICMHCVLQALTRDCSTLTFL